MLRRTTTLHGLARLALAVGLGACGIAPGQPGAASADGAGGPTMRKADAFKPPGNRRIANLGTFAVAFETKRACRLQKAEYKSVEPPQSGWEDVGHNELAGQFFELHDIDPTMGVKDVSTFNAVVISTTGERYWLRNEPAEGEPAGTAAHRWHCAVGVADLKKLEPKLQAQYVQLDRSRCARLTPILGGVDDLSSSTYTVLDAAVFAGAPPSVEDTRGNAEAATYAIGIRMESEGGTKRLTVPSTDFDACFARATRTPPPPGEARALADWLRQSDADTTPPPAASLETVETVMGIRREQCAEADFGGSKGLECHTPLLTANTTASGPFGPSRVELVKERLVRGLYFVDGKLVPPTKAVRVVARVRSRGADDDSAFAAAFKDAMRFTIADEQAQMRRAARGRFRLELDQGGTTHTVTVKTSYDIPEMEVRTEPREHRYVAGKKQVPNPEWNKAQKDVREAEAQVEAAKTEGDLIQQKIENLKKLCDKGANAAGNAAGKAAAKQAGGLFGGLIGSAVSASASAGCDTAKEVAEQTAIKNRIAEAETKLEQARNKAKNTSKTRPVDDKRVYHYNAKHYRRRGTARATIEVSPRRDSHRALFRQSVDVPFEAEATEIPNVPDVGLVGKPASPPSKADAERELARHLVPLIDQAIMKWGTQQDVGGDVGDVKPGTRSWMVLLSRQAATNRPVKLLSDILDNREKNLAAGRVGYPVVLPADLDGRCFTFGAISLDGETDVNLGLVEGGRVVARDLRSDPDASFELCDLSPGEHQAVVEFNGDPPRAVLVSLFESTPEKVTLDEVRKATQGIPSIASRGDAMRLDGSGRVESKGIGGRVVVGQTGDRDGDGVGDDVDRCPYEPEVENQYLDDDGCPDEPPVGWKPPAQEAPAPAAAKTEPDKKSKAARKKEKRRSKSKRSKKKKGTEVFVP